MSKKPSPGLILFATLVIQALGAMGLISLPVVAPVVAQTIGISPAYLGAYIALVYVAAMISSIMGGPYVIRLGALRVSQICLGFTTTGTLLCAIPSVWTIGLGALFIGMGYGPVTPASSHLLIKTTPPNRLALVFSIKQTGVPLGGMMAGMILPGLEVVIGWQMAFVAVAVICVTTIILVNPLRAQLDNDRLPDSRMSLRSTLLDPVRLVMSVKNLRVLAAISFLFSVCQLSVTTYLVTFLYEDLGMTLIAAGVALTVAQAAGVGGRILWGWLADKWFGAGAMLIVVGVLLGSAAVGLALLTDNSMQWLFYLILIVIGSTAIGWNGVYLAEVARQAPPGKAGMATGGSLGFTFMGVLFGPPLFGVAATAFGSYGLSYTLLVIPMALTMLLLWSRRRRQAWLGEQ